jgi:hypothetical protein
MKYLLLVYFDEKVLEQVGKAEEQKIETECLQYMERLQAQGKFLGSNRLQPVSTATSVRTQGGKKVVTDGPFAETREQLGGYTLVDAKDLDEAIEIASKMGPGRLGTIEIRPVLEFGQF